MSEVTLYCGAAPWARARPPSLNATSPVRILTPSHLEEETFIDTKMTPPHSGDTVACRNSWSDFTQSHERLYTVPRVTLHSPTCDFTQSHGVTRLGTAPRSGVILHSPTEAQAQHPDYGMSLSPSVFASSSSSASSRTSCFSE